MPENELMVFGSAIKQEKIRKDLGLTYFQRQLFRIRPLESKTTVCVKRKKESGATPSSTSKIALKKKKDERLHDLLTTPVDVKKRKTTIALDKQLVRLSSRSVALSDDVDGGRERASKPPFSIDRLHSGAEPCRFDLAELIPYLSKAYNDLYGRHLNNLKEITTRVEPFEQSVILESSRPCLEVRGIVQFHLSRGESQDVYD